jgi:hypothetical protein
VQSPGFPPVTWVSSCHLGFRGRPEFALAGFDVSVRKLGLASLRLLPVFVEAAAICSLAPLTPESHLAVSTLSSLLSEVGRRGIPGLWAPVPFRGCRRPSLQDSGPRPQGSGAPGWPGDHPDGLRRPRGPVTGERGVPPG